ncbi:TPA: glycosyltransferase [Escherichia coli]|uniref:glycosyltransferase n=2 Tax=Escherichia coli TaxID=562 RepID=UPI00068E6DD6|nr:glycosyltransferase [Escherichia coli]ARQ25678.1 hypothetical protein BMI82_18860 [Escherichia coli]ARR34710.1 hypothetical protein CA593_17180 [Escherichia coli]EFH9453456.1 glycosyltransferase [Escherichia coli]EFP0184039.1 glycosyltransferase [Escherichia coli]EGO3715579.1 glycosyltransferase [Escherichia coli]
MKILLIHNTLPSYRVSLFNNLAKKDTVHAYFYAASLNQKVYGDTNRFNELKNVTLIENFRSKENIKDLIRGEYSHIILPPLDDFKALLVSYFVLFLCNKKSKLCLFWEKWNVEFARMGIKKKLKNIFLHFAIGLLIKKIDVFLCPGIKTRQYLLSLGVESKRIKLVGDCSAIEAPLNFEADKKIRDKYVSNDATVILYYGRIIHRKGLEILINAFHRLEKEGKNVFLLVCGDGPQRKDFEKLAQTLNITNIKFMGYIAPEERYKFFTASDLFVLPSYYFDDVNEAWGLTVNEALAYGLPVIATDMVGSAHDLITPKNGILIKENNTDELYYAIKQAINTNYNKSEIVASVEKYNPSAVSSNILNAMGNN